MLTFAEAYVTVLEHAGDYGTEECSLIDSLGRVLAEDVKADRDFPPYNRATRDGIAIAFEEYKNGRRSFEVEHVLAAGVPTHRLVSKKNCVEIMTGAVVPYDTDTVVMYEHVKIEKEIATIKKEVVQGQNIHQKGSDAAKGSVVIPAGQRITAAEIGILAGVGNHLVKLRKNPKIAVISTGNEIIPVDQIPLNHQIRRSNAPTLVASLAHFGISPLSFHVVDDKDLMRQKLNYILEEMDVLLMSGGVSKGKFDYLPQIFKELGVKTIFHRVRQRPGKPFLFGKQEKYGTLVFSYPGNPVSGFATHHTYFNAWLHRSLGLPSPQIRVKLKSDIKGADGLTQLIPVRQLIEKAEVWVEAIPMNGSGDYISLNQADGLIILDEENKNHKKGQLVPFIPTR